MNDRSPLDIVRAWSLAGLFAALSLFMVMLAGGTYSLMPALLDAGHRAIWIYVLIAIAVPASLLCANAARKGFVAAYKGMAIPHPPWIAIALVAAVMVIATALYDGF